jgi:hypothetical protein
MLEIKSYQAMRRLMALRNGRWKSLIDRLQASPESHSIRGKRYEDLSCIVTTIVKVDHSSFRTKYGSPARSRQRPDPSESRRFQLRPDCPPSDMHFRVRHFLKPDWLLSAFGQILMWFCD